MQCQCRTSAVPVQYQEITKIRPDRSPEGAKFRTNLAPDFALLPGDSPVDLLRVRSRADPHTVCPRKKSFDPTRPETFPVELRFADPNNPSCVNGDPLYVFSARRSWTVGDVKDELRSVARLSRLSQKLSLSAADREQECELEDASVLKDVLPGGSSSVRLTLFTSPDLYCEYGYLLKVGGPAHSRGR